MNVKDIQGEQSFDLWVKPLMQEDSLSPDLGVGRVRPGENVHEYNIFFPSGIRKVHLCDGASGIDFTFYLARGSAHLAEIIQTAHDGSALLRVVFFNGAILEFGEVDIGLDDRIVETAEQKGFRGARDLKKLAAYLEDSCCIPMGEKSSEERYFVILGSRSSWEDFEGSEDAEGREAVEIVDERYRAFSLCGKGLRMPVQKKLLSRDEEIFWASKILFKDHQSFSGAIRLARGVLRFTSMQVRIKALAAGTMKQLMEDQGGYLRQWDAYGAKEGELLLERAKAVGVVAVNAMEHTEKGVRLFISSGVPEGIAEGDALELVTSLPPYLQNPDMTWEEYSTLLEKRFRSKEKAPQGERGEYFSVIGCSENSIDLAVDGHVESFDHGYLVLSIAGDRIQIERRMKARLAILEGRSANPMLGLLIEENGEIPEVQRVTKIKPLTPFVQKKIFGHPPTEKQVEALGVALNTPDIALIQGPPGTGKTTVITAILERLNEEYDKRGSIRGQILVSGFQHDAVENIVSRLSINALPAVKFGKRSSDSEFTSNAVIERMYKWSEDVAERLREKNPEIVSTEAQKRLRELFSAYIRQPSLKNAHNILKKILELPEVTLTKDVIDKTRILLESLESERIAIDTGKLRTIRALRMSKKGFSDDGPLRAMDLLEALEEELESAEIALVERASRWCEGQDMDFLHAMRDLKRKLIIRYTPRPDFRREKPREDILELITQVSQEMDTALKIKSKRDTVLAELLHELENNPEGILQSVQEYNFVFAATTQQAEGSEIRRVKVQSDGDMVTYDTVIVDEAARTSPRDLLIPMSQAKKRIILVGDHRQLPHIIDEEVARALEKEESSDFSEAIFNKDFIEKSMFAYLFSRLKKLEEKDHIPRTVTLDAQYRMHPLLGEFVSDNFYKPYGEGFRSPLGTENFRQNLQDLSGRATAWIHVAHERGGERRTRSFSRERPVEAKVIAERMNTWMHSAEGEGLSFGIISFYKAQIYVIYEALAQYGITERTPDGAWQVAEKYRFLKKEGGDAALEERLRIGTVDAFQGMEFDVVLLSMVRTHGAHSLSEKKKQKGFLERLVSGNRPSLRQTRSAAEERKESPEYEKKQRSIFGHLMSKNRLCVSMSRQKRVLAVVGDGELVQTDIAEDAVPELRNYYYLCKKQGVIL